MNADFHKVTAAEIVAIHDRLLLNAPGLAGMPDPERAEAVYSRVWALHDYDALHEDEHTGAPVVFYLAAAYLQAIARGHIFNDCNKRTALMCAVLFLARNGVLINPTGEALEELTVNTATGKATRDQIAASFQMMAE
ncbi:TPA: type II toxin-antitoxin system death-on-curing family toxin [Enterobacter hormaechei subsp. steigerwaltii]|nr:type II toxin-antitoxin system death-on-curing family toxin [Enterobacter hormaechei subsp. steigerwaltii]